MIKNPIYFSLPRQFYLFQGGIIFGYFALRLMVLGTSWWCLAKTHSTVALGSVISASVLLELLAVPLAAPLGDRFGAKLIKVTFAIQALCLFMLASAALFLKTFSLVAVVPLLVISQLADAARDPLADSLLPQLIGNDALVDGERVRRALGTLSRILGPVVGGAVTAMMGPSITLYLAAAALVVGGYMCMASGAGRPRARAQVGATSRKSSGWVRELAHGFLSVIAIRTELAIAFGNSFLTVAVSTFMLIALPQLAQETRGAWVMGAVDGAFGCGVFVAATLVVKPLNGRFGPRLANARCGVRRAVRVCEGRALGGGRRLRARLRVGARRDQSHRAASSSDAARLSDTRHRQHYVHLVYLSAGRLVRRRLGRSRVGKRCAAGQPLHLCASRDAYHPVRAASEEPARKGQAGRRLRLCGIVSESLRQSLVE